MIALTKHRRGRLIEIFLGNMRGGKTDALIREIESLREHSDRKVVCFKPDKDIRSAKGFIESRKKNGEVLHSLEAIEFLTERPEEMIRILGKMVAAGDKIDVVALDEAQFCKTEKLYPVFEALLDRGHDLLIAGLALDFKREPFGATLALIGLSDNATKTNWKLPVCDKCREHRARFPQRLIDGEPAGYNEPQISVEGSKKKEKYEVRCEFCHELPGKPY